MSTADHRGVDLSSLKGGQMTIATTLDSPLFVEAGAGSGKTFTLTKRVAWALSPGSGEGGEAFLDGLDQVLVITFTEAAAREIRERVRYELRRSGMEEEALRVDEAWISTIHGMCSRILHRHALDLGLDPNFGMAGTSQARDLLVSAIDAALERVLHESRFAALFSEFGVGAASAGSGLPSTGVFGLVERLLSAGHSLPGGVGELEAAHGDEAEVREVMADVLGRFEELRACRGLSAKAVETLDASLESLRAFDALAPGQKTTGAALEALATVSLPRSSSAIAELHPGASSQLALARAELAFLGTAALAPDLLDIALEAERNYVELKTGQNVLDYDDLVRLALSAVRDNEEVRRAYAGRFRLVMVDEFQDTDEMQLELIRLLAGGGDFLCTVGDAQQSIYRFRGADVSVFRLFGEELGEERTVRLDLNFRSHSDVLAFVERVSTGGEGGASGTMDSFMHLDAASDRRGEYEARSLPRIDVEVVGGPTRGAKAEVVGAMANQVADAFARYRDAGISPGDMALLLGVTTNVDAYIDAIRARGMECVVTGGSTFSDAPEVRLMCALLHTLANPADTQSGLFPLLASEVFGLDANDFCDLGTQGQGEPGVATKRRIDQGLATLELFGGRVPSRRLARAHEVVTRALDQVGTRPVADICADVVRDSGWLSRLEGQGAAGRARAANVLAAVRYIRDLTESLGLGPARAATEFELWLDASKIAPATLADAGEGTGSETVTVMTIHASKGLEFKVCAVAECWGNVTGQPALVTLDRDSAGRRPFILKPKSLEKKLTDRIDAEDLEPSADRSRALPLCARYLSVCRESLEADRREKARLLYVALTRAREALILCVDARTSGKGVVSSDLAALTLDALGINPSAEGAGSVDYGGTEEASLTCLVARKAEEGEEDGQDNPEDGAQEEPEAFDLYELPAGTPGSAGSWSAREGVFSYSSVHAAMSDDTRSSSETKRARDAGSEGSAFLDDADRATNLGSAFHELAQAMVESGRVPTDAHVRSMARYWNLSGRAEGRLRAALDRWEGSRIRAEALSHGRLQAEAPFFQRLASEHGDYLEGAIDLLCTDEGSAEALVVDYKTGDAGLTPAEARNRHAMQAEFYAGVLLREGYEKVDCAFVCVEREDPEQPGEPLVLRYAFTA